MNISATEMYERITKALSYIGGRLKEAKDDGTYVLVGNTQYLPISNLEYVAEILEGKYWDKVACKWIKKTSIS